MRLDVGKLSLYCEGILQNAQVPMEQARIMIEALIEADLMGLSTHGVSRLNFYLEHIENGTINAKPNLQIVNEFSSMALVDADKAMGPVSADFAIRHAMQKADKTGVGVISVKNSTHMGALSVCTKKAAANKMIGVAISNTSPIMAPWGGAEAALGNNPISIAVPTGKEFPYVLDMALSVIARGNIILAAREGKDIPEHWAVNQDGRATTNAADALLGAVLPLAQHKGYALAFMFDVLAAVLSGAAYGKDVGSFVPPEHSKPLDFGHFIMAIDIKKFSAYDEFLERLNDYVLQVKGCKKAQGCLEILVPGEIESKRYLTNIKQGIELTQATIKMLKTQGEKYNVNPDPFAFN